ALGRTFLSGDAGKLDGDPVVVISDAAWHRYLKADPAAIGRKLSLNGASFTVIGVAPPAFRGHVAMLQPEFFVPLTLSPLINANTRHLMTSRNSRWLVGGGRLAAGASLDQARAQLSALAERLAKQFPDSPRDARFSVAPLS